MLTCVTFLTHTRRSRKWLVTNDAPRSLRASVRLCSSGYSCSYRVHSRCRSVRKFAAVSLCAAVPSTILIGLGEDVNLIPPLALNPAAALSNDSATTYPELRAAMSYKIAMSPHAGADRLDRDIQTAQRRVREAPEPRPFLEQLGWLYVAKARASYDPGFYKL